MSEIFTYSQLRWIGDHAVLLGVVSTLLVMGGLYLLVIWIDGGIDDSAADDFVPYIPSGDD